MYPTRNNVLTQKIDTVADSGCKSSHFYCIVCSVVQCLRIHRKIAAEASSATSMAMPVSMTAKAKQSLIMTKPATYMPASMLERMRSSDEYEGEKITSLE